MTASRYFKGAPEREVRPHLLRGGGLSREVFDLRNDTERGFLRVEQEIAGVWKDLPGTISQGTGGASLTYEAYRDTPLKMYFWRCTQDDELHYIYQMQHDWDPTTAVKPHLHVRPMAPSGGVVIVDGYYAWDHVGVVLPALSGWSPFSVPTTFVAGDQYKHKIISLGEVQPGEGCDASSMLHIYLRRPGASDGDDTYEGEKDHGTVTANLGLISSDVHYRTGRVGTPAEYPTG